MKKALFVVSGVALFLALFFGVVALHDVFENSYDLFYVRLFAVAAVITGVSAPVFVGTWRELATAEWTEL